MRFTTADIGSRSLRALLRTMLTPGVPVVTVPEAAALAKQACFIDCRERSEYEVSHLPGAVWVGYRNFDASRVPAGEGKLIAYCSIGKRSDEIVKKLQEGGFSNVYNLAGGIFEWANQGYLVYKDGKAAGEVHVYNSFWRRWLKRGTPVC
jgi:rhodanese-related sulfurtransferase